MINKVADETGKVENEVKKNIFAKVKRWQQRTLTELTHKEQLFNVFLVGEKIKKDTDINKIRKKVIKIIADEIIN